MKVDIEREIVRKLALLAKDRGQCIEECANTLLTEAFVPLEKKLEQLQKKSEKEETKLSKAAA
ncbi:hypothetical protein OAN22_02630 [Alphaproteobacteria bacterium]|nr:hypothetical protein [Alphaproteobacteria bacterium]